MFRTMYRHQLSLALPSPRLLATAVRGMRILEHQLQLGSTEVLTFDKKVKALFRLPTLRTCQNALKTATEGSSSAMCSSSAAGWCSLLVPKLPAANISRSFALCSVVDLVLLEAEGVSKMIPNRMGNPRSSIDVIVSNATKSGCLAGSIARMQENMFLRMKRNWPGMAGCNNYVETS